MSRTLTEKTEFPVITPDIYNAEVLEVSEGQNTMYPTYDDGQPRIEVTFKFRILDGEFEDQFVWGRTTPTFTTNPDCKLRKWVQAIMGLDEIPVGFSYEDEDLVGKDARIFVQHTSTGKAKVADVLPASKTSVSAAAPAADFGEEPF